MEKGYFKVYHALLIGVIGLGALGYTMSKWSKEIDSKLKRSKAVIKSVEDILAGEDNMIDTKESQGFLNDPAIGYKRAIPQGDVVFFEQTSAVRVNILAGEYRSDARVLMNVSPEALEEYIARHKGK